MPINPYLRQQLGGLECFVMDSAYVIFNLYMRRLRQRQSGEQPPARPPASGISASGELRDSTRSMGSDSPARSLAAAMLPFVRAMIEMEHRRLGAGDAAAVRTTRRRFLESTYAAQLPPIAARLLGSVTEVVSAVQEAYEAEGELSRTLPPRARRVEVQSGARRRLAALKQKRRELEATLNELNAGPGDDTEVANDEHGAGADTVAAARDGLYQSCDVLYASLLLPRIAVAEMLLSVQTALAIRSAEVCEFAQRHVDAALCLTRTAGEMAGAAASVTSASSPPLSAALARTVSALPTVDDVGPLFYSSFEASVPPIAELVRCCDQQDEDVRVAAMAAAFFATEVPAAARRLVDAVATMTRLHHKVRVGPVAEVDAISFRESLEAAGIDDAAHFIHIVCGVPGSLQEATVASAKEPSDEPPLLAHTTGSSGAGGGAVATARASPSMPRAVSFTTGMHRSPSVAGRAHDGTGRQEAEGIEDDEGSHPPPPPPLRQPSAGSFRRTHSGASQSAASPHGSMRLSGFADITARLEELLDLVADEGSPQLPQLMSQLYDSVGQFNLALRRHGLSEETRRDPATGKVVPACADEGSVYLPHSIDDTLGLTRERSAAYECACLRYELWAKLQRVRRQLEELAEAPDEDFFRACHEDLLEALLRDADEVCFVGVARGRVERRVEALMRIRVKVFHHTGEIRAVTLPQKATLGDLLSALAPWMPDIRRCKLSFLDDGDKVRVASDAEFKELIRLRRCAVLEGFALGQSQLSRSGVVSSSDLKLELYVDPPPPLPPRTPAAAAPPHRPPQETTAPPAPPPPPPPPPPSQVADADLFIEQQMRFYERKMAQLGLRAEGAADAKGSGAQTFDPHRRRDIDEAHTTERSPGRTFHAPPSSMSFAEVCQRLEAGSAAQGSGAQEQSRPQSGAAPPREFVLDPLGPGQCVVHVTERDHRRLQSERAAAQGVRRRDEGTPHACANSGGDAGASVVVAANGHAPRWGVPSGARPLELVRHQLADSTQAAFDAFNDDDDDDDERRSDEEFERALEARSRWRNGARGSDDHVGAVLRAGARQALVTHAAQPRHSGPQRRGATPRSSSRPVRRR